MTAETPTNRLPRGAAVLVLGVLLVLLMCMGILPLDLVTVVLGGWFRYLADTAPRVRINWLSLLSAAMWIALFAGGLHWFCRWLYGSRETSETTDVATLPRRWRVRWTAMLVGLVVFLFAAGTSAVCVAHQIGFLATSESPMFAIRDRTADSRTVDIEQFVRRHAGTAVTSDLWHDAIRWHLSSSPFLDHHHVIAWSTDRTDVDGVIAFHRDPELRRQHGIVVATGGRQVVLSGDELPKALALIPPNARRAAFP